MKRTFIAASLILLAAAASAQAGDPDLVWRIQRLDAAQKPLLESPIVASDYANANSAAKAACARRPAAASLRVTLAPARKVQRAGDKRRKTAVVPCSAYANDGDALRRYITPPNVKPDPKGTVRLW